MAAAGKGGGTPLSILFKIEGVEQAKQLLAGLAPEFAKIQSEADKTGKSVGGAAKGFTDLGNAGKSIDPLSKSLDSVSKSGTSVTQTGTKIKQSFDQTKTSSEGAVTSYQKYNSEGQKITSTNTNVSGSIEKVGTSTKGASTSFDAMASSTGKLASESDKSKGSVDALGTAHTTLKGNVDAAKGGLDAHNTTLTTVDQSSTKTAASTTQLGSSFMAQVGSATALIGSATTLWQSYDSLGDAQLRVDKATNTLHATQIKIQTLQTQLNKLTLEGKEGTDEYAIVQDKLQLAQDKLAANEGTLNNAQEDLNVTYSNFARDIIPQVVTVFGSFTSLLANSKGGLSGFAQGIKGIGTEGSAVSKILSMISLTNPFFIAITVGAALVGAFVTNLFGFRDAVNSLGVALGKAVPFLKPLLDLMGGFGQGVVDALGMGDKATKSFADNTETSMDKVGTSLEGTGTHIKSFAELNAQTLRDTDGHVVDFTNAYLENMYKNKGETTSFGGSLTTLKTTAQTEFGAIIGEADKVLMKWEQLNSLKTQTPAPGVPGQEQYATKFTDVPLSKRVASIDKTGKNLPFVEPEGLDKLDAVMTRLSPKTGQVIFDLNAMRKVAKDQGFDPKPIEEYAKALGLIPVTTDKVLDANGNWIDASKSLQSEQDNQKTSQAGLTATTEAGVATAQKGVATTMADMEAKRKSGLIATDLQKKEAGRNAGLDLMEGKLKAAQGEELLYSNILQDRDAIQSTINEGIDRQQAAMAKGRVELLGNVSASAEYTKQLGTAQGAGLEFGKGLLAGNDALNATAASALQTAGQVYYLSDSQNMANMKAASFSQGMQEQALAMKNTQVETEKTRGTVEKMREQWVTGEAQSTAFNKAVQDQALAFEQSKVNVEALKGTLSELVTEWNSGEAATVAFNTAFQEQEIQATKNLAANEALKGTYSALVMEYDNGITTFNAVNKGFMEQEISIYKVVEAADELKGKILAMDQEWESGAAQLSSFIKGYYEQETAFRESAKAGEALKGTVAAMATEFNNQYTALQNSNIGMVEQQKVIMDAMTAYQKGSGTLEEYNTQLQSGLPQALAYQSAIDKTKMAMGQQQEATAALLGTTVELMDELGSAEGVITRYFKGFAEGYNEITKWAGGIEEAIGKDKAMQQAVMETADKLGVDLPEGFRGSVESAKEWIEISKGVPATLESIARTAAEAGKSLRSGLVDALSDDKGDLDKAFEGIEKKLGSGLSDTVKNALTKAAIGDKMVNEFQTAVDLISTVKADPAALSETVNTVMEKFESLVMDHPALESMRTELESALSALQVDPNNQAALDQVRNILGRVKDEALGLNKTIPPLNSTIKDQTTEMVDVNAAWKAYVDTLGNIDITKAVQDFKTLTAGVDAAQQAIRRYNDQNKVGLNEMYASGDTRAVYASTDPSTLGGESITVGEDIQKYNEGAGRYAAQGPLGGGANVDFTAQIAQIDAFKTKLAEVAPAVTAMVTASNAALATFMQPLATITGPALTLVEQMLLKLPTDVTTMVQTANGGLATFMQPLATITGPALVLIEQMLLKVPTDVTTMVTTSNANLATFMQPLATITGPALVLIEQMLLKVPTDVTTMVTTANTNLTPLFTPLTATIFPKMQTDAATSFQAVTNIATEESGKIPPLFETAATAIDTALKKTENTSATTFEAVVNIGKEEADKLGPIFDTAAKDIDTALKEVETTSAETFEAVTTSAEDSGESVTTAMEDASQAVQDALDEMEQKATDTFESISESAQEATESVEELADAIDSLEDKTVTITTRYVTEGSPGAATGFGPTVVEHPMNLTVGEAGPEYVSIIPLSSASKKNLPTAERLAIFGDPGKKRKNPLRTTMDLSNTSPYSNYQAKTVGRIPMALGTVNNYSNMTSNSDMSSVVISGSAITSFSNSISRFSSSVERQNSIMQQSAAVNSTNVYGNGGGGRSGFSLPDLSIGGNGRGGRSSGSAGMGGFDNLVTAIKEAVLAAFSRTSINLTSNTILDSEKINANQNKVFGLRNGAMLK